MSKRKVLVIGAAGYLAGRVLPAYRERYDLVLLDVKTANRDGEEVEGVQIANLVDSDRDTYRVHFKGVDLVVHCGAAKPGGPRQPLQEAGETGAPDICFQGRPWSRGDDQGFELQMKNIQMANNIYQTSIEEGV